MHYSDKLNLSDSLSPQQSETLKNLIEEALRDEFFDSDYYYGLADFIDDIDDKKTVLNIHMDEEKHKNLFGALYSMLTGNNPPEYEDEEIIISENLPDEFYSKIMDETDAVDFYTRILSNLTEKAIRDILIEIISDESIHADLMNALYAKYKA